MHAMFLAATDVGAGYSFFFLLEYTVAGGSYIEEDAAILWSKYIYIRRHTFLCVSFPLVGLSRSDLVKGR